VVCHSPLSIAENKTSRRAQSGGFYDALNHSFQTREERAREERAFIGQKQKFFVSLFGTFHIEGVKVHFFLAETKDPW
jgi:hypothetical protein